MKIGFYGAGKVGFSLGKYFSINGLSVTGYYNRNPESARDAAAFTNTRYFDNVEELIRESDCIFLTVSDGAVKKVYDSLKSPLISGKIFCHCSGSLSAEEVFSDIADFGACACSVHPLFPVSSRYESYKELHKAFFCIEGDNSCSSLRTDIFNKLGNPVREISPQSKIKYHAACSVISNLFCALAKESLSLMSECGFSENEAASALYPLAKNNLENVFSVGPVSAMTGPIERNDIETVRRHIASIDDPLILDTYISASRQLVEMAQQRHPETDYSGMRELLNK